MCLDFKLNADRQETTSEDGAQDECSVNEHSTLEHHSHLKETENKTDAKPSKHFETKSSGACAIGMILFIISRPILFIADHCMKDKTNGDINIFLQSRNP